MCVPSGSPASPFTGSNWDGTGVEPDIEVPAEDAYSNAYRLALLKVKELYQDVSGYGFLVKGIDEELVKMK